ncbi:MAG: MarR family winged helix-turn-helix transcriptional regulator [Caulobacteraceae bacterium]|nr:MarR family winged helix-turn-helix transcriptional regulator [Caulobacteraceae bacterium]
MSDRARVNPLEPLLGYQLRRASAAMQADLNTRLATAGVTTVEMSILLVVEANPQITQSEIGRMLSIKSANMAPLVGGLCNRGLMERMPVNGRSHGLRLTKAGEGIIGDLLGHIRANEEAIMAHLSSPQREQAKQLLRALWADKR